MGNAKDLEEQMLDFDMDRQAISRLVSQVEDGMDGSLSGCPPVSSDIVDPDKIAHIGDQLRISG